MSRWNCRDSRQAMCETGARLLKVAGALPQMGQAMSREQTSETPLRCSDCHPANDCWDDRAASCDGRFRYYERELAAKDAALIAEREAHAETRMLLEHAGNRRVELSRQVEDTRAALRQSEGARVDLHGKAAALLIRAESAESALATERAGKERAERDAAVGAAIQKAAAELPDGFEVEISVERGAATVRLHDPYGDTTIMDVDADNRLAGEINAAVDAALAARGDHHHE